MRMPCSSWLQGKTTALQHFFGRSGEGLPLLTRTQMNCGLSFDLLTSASATCNYTSFCGSNARRDMSSSLGWCRVGNNKTPWPMKLQHCAPDQKIPLPIHLQTSCVRNNLVSLETRVRVVKASYTKGVGPRQTRTVLQDEASNSAHALVSFTLGWSQGQAIGTSQNHVT